MYNIPVAVAGMHPVCGCDTEHMHHHNRTPKQSKLFSDKVAPRHISYIQTSKTHYQFGQMSEKEAYLTPGL